MIGIKHSELENEGREEEENEEEKGGGEKMEWGMNFAVAGQNSFVWFIAHAYAPEKLVLCFYLNTSGMMKDS